MGIDKICAMPIKDLELSTRTKGGLIAVGVVTVGEFAYMTEKEFLRIGNLGRKSLNEIKSVLSAFGVTMGALASEGLRFPWHENLEPEIGWTAWHLRQSMPRERGRPRLPPEGKRQQIGVRTSPSLKTALEAAAAANCRSVAQEAEWRLERSFADADLRLRVNQIEQRLEAICPSRPYGE